MAARDAADGPTTVHGENMRSDGWLSQETVSLAKLTRRIEELRGDGHVQLTLLTATDWLEEGEFEVSYLLTDPVGCRTVVLGVRIPRETPELPTVSDVWPQAVTYEQELNEMFGIRFEGSPRQGVPFILEGWKDMPPMRRDFDTLKYSVEHYEDRPGRRSIDTRRYVGRVADEKSYGAAWAPREDDGRKRRLAGVDDGVMGAGGGEDAADGENAVRGENSNGGESADE